MGLRVEVDRRECGARPPILGRGPHPYKGRAVVPGRVAAPRRLPAIPASPPCSPARGSRRRWAVGDAPGVGRLAAGVPGADPRRPVVQHGVRVAAGVHALGAMEAQVHEVGRDLLGQRVHAGVVGDDQGDVVLAEQVDEFGDQEALVADLDHVPDRPVRGGLGCRVRDPVVVVAGEARGVVVVAWEQLEERAQPLRPEAEPLGELPQDRAQLPAQRQHALAEEVGQRLRRVVELLHVGDEAAALDGEHEVVGRGITPRLEVRLPLERVERAVDLDGGEAAARVLHLGALRQAGRVELAAPAGVAPA
jgi:hypothetical protein